MLSKDVDEQLGWLQDVSEMSGDLLHDVITGNLPPETHDTADCWQDVIEASKNLIAKMNAYRQSYETGVLLTETKLTPADRKEKEIQWNISHL